MLFDDKILKLKSLLPIDTSFDVLGREIIIDNKRAYFVFVDGFSKDEILYYLLNDIQKNCESFDNLEQFVKKDISYIECDIIKNDEEFKTLTMSVLCGMFALIIDGFSDYILLDTREYPVRGVSESEVEKVIRGSKDSFVETILFNTALIRRRIRSEKLVFEIEKVGNFSKTDLAISYIDGLVNQEVLNTIREKIKNIDTNAIVLSSEYIEEFLFKKKWYNPLPLVKYTERPDVASSYLAEGYVVLIVDTSPVAIVLPVYIFNFMQHIGDYNAKFINGTLTRFFRLLSTLLMTFLAPVFVYLADNTKVFESIAKKGDVADEILFSYFIQIMILEVAFLILQFSSIHIPAQIAPLIGIIGGLLLGDIAIKLGIFTPIALLTMVITVITTYAIPSMEFSDSLRIFRFFIIIATGVFGLKGLIISILFMIIITLTTETIKGAKRYTYPLIPFDFSDLKSLILRENAKDMK